MLLYFGHITMHICLEKDIIHYHEAGIEENQNNTAKQRRRVDRNKSRKGSARTMDDRTEWRRMIHGAVNHRTDCDWRQNKQVQLINYFASLFYDESTACYSKWVVVAYSLCLFVSLMCAPALFSYVVAWSAEKFTSDFKYGVQIWYRSSEITAAILHFIIARSACCMFFGLPQSSVPSIAIFTSLPCLYNYV